MKKIRTFLSYRESKKLTPYIRKDMIKNHDFFYFGVTPKRSDTLGTWKDVVNCKRACGVVFYCAAVDSALLRHILLRTRSNIIQFTKFYGLPKHGKIVFDDADEIEARHRAVKYCINAGYVKKLED